MKNVKKLAAQPTKLSAKKKALKAKNLSPAKKFRLRLRRAKFQKQQQAKEDYFEHDNREMARASVEGQKKAGRLYKKGRRAQMYIDAYLKSQHMSQNGDTASPDETQDSSNGNDAVIKSIVHRAALPMTSRFQHAFGKEQAVHSARVPSYPAVNTAKCCCHCACSGAKRKARRKLSSPYFGDFNRTMSFANGSCANGAAGVTTKILNKTTTTTHHVVGGCKILDYGQLSAKLMVPVLPKKYKLQGRSGAGGMKEMRSVVRWVEVFLCGCFRSFSAPTASRDGEKFA